MSERVSGVGQSSMPVAEEPAVVLATSVLFGGEVIKLGSGASVTVKPWGVKLMARDIPAILGRLTALLGSKAYSKETIIAVMISQGSEEMLNLVAATCGIDKESVLMADGVTAEDLLRLVTATVKQNEGFFVALSELRELLNKELGRGKSQDDKLPSGTP